MSLYVSGPRASIGYIFGELPTDFDSTFWEPGLALATSLGDARLTLAVFLGFATSSGRITGGFLIDFSCRSKNVELALTVSLGKLCSSLAVDLGIP